MTPHLAEECWAIIGKTTVLTSEPWPEVKQDLLVKENTTIIIQVNGKKRGELTIGMNSSKDEVIQESLDFSLVTLSPGISASISREKFLFNFGLGISLNVISWEADFRESLDTLNDGMKSQEINSWQSASSGNDVLFGAFLHAATGMQISEEGKILV